MRLKGEKIYIKSKSPQSSENAFMAYAAGSGFQLQYFLTLWFKLEAKRSMEGVPHFLQIFSKMFWGMLHSRSWSQALLSRSASVLNSDQT